VHVIESSPADRVQPRLKSWRYTKPGDRIAQTRLVLCDLEAKKQLPLDHGLFPNPWSIGNLRWAADSSRFTFLYNQRGHQVMRIVTVDSRTGEATSLIEDAPETFFNYFQKLFHYYLDDRGQIIWMSERDGWNHLYLFHSTSGKLVNQVTRGEWVVRGVDRIDPEKQQIWFRAGGMNPEEDPYHIHYCRINFDGTGLVRLTAGDGTHNIRFSPDRRYFIDHYSRVDLPPVHELRRSEDGRLVTRLEEADIRRLQDIPGWSMPERFVARGRDGKTDIWGVIHRPSRLDPTRKYPVVEKIYAGPHGHYVPKRFYDFFTAMDIAELGCVVVVIDGMGTNWRSKAFHDVCWQNLRDAGFPDRIRWMQAAARKYPYLDLSRVGIYGGSAGGQNALGALLFHPDFYKVAVSDCGCHDNRMDKIHWNEAWMGLMGPHYAENSNVTHAHKLQGKLFLTVGELDTNVDPASTMQVVNALIRANKDFDFLLVPGAGHGVGETPYLRRRRQDFFVRHLLGVEPREN
jgi:dipeptidyl aminopeptidase/acylaminoacyl peptidase